MAIYKLPPLESAVMYFDTTACGTRWEPLGEHQ